MTQAGFDWSADVRLPVAGKTPRTRADTSLKRPGNKAGSSIIGSGADNGGGIGGIPAGGGVLKSTGGGGGGFS